MLFQSTESRPFSSQSSFRLKFPNWFLFSIHHIACSYLEFVNERWVVQVKTQSYSIFFSQQQRKSVGIIFLVVNMNSRTKRYIYSLCCFIKKKLCISSILVYYDISVKGWRKVVLERQSLHQRLNTCCSIIAVAVAAFAYICAWNRHFM